MPGWQQVGAGFSGLKKFQIRKGERCSSVESDDIIEERTPEFKDKFSKKRTLRNVQSKKLTSETNLAWRPQNLQTLFESCNKKESITQESEKIVWSDSSSDNELIRKENLGNDKKRKRKMKHFYCKNTKNSFINSLTCPDGDDSISQCPSSSDSINLKSSVHKSQDLIVNIKQEFVNDHSKNNKCCIPFAQRKVKKSTKGIFTRKFKSKQDLDSSDGEISDIASEDDHALFSDASDSSNIDKTPSQQICTQSSSMHSWSCDRQVSGSQMSDNVNELSSPLSSPQRKVIRASEWINVAYKNAVSPGKSTDQLQECHPDSAKKNRKFSKSSLSGQLSRLINREKSAVRFWYHSFQAGVVNDGNTKTINVKLLHMRHHFSLYICKCKVISSSQSDKEVCNITFQPELVDRLELKVGTEVQIFPPWQLLEEVSGVCTLLCTQYVCVVSQPIAIQSSSKTTENTWDIHAVWKCPCVEVQEPVNIPNKCSAINELTDKFIQAWRPSESVVGEGKVRCLQAVSGLTVDTLACDGDLTLLEALETAGPHMLQLPAFSATVLRVFLTSDGYEVLLEDYAGTLALIHHIEKSETHNNVPLPHLEESQCSCFGLNVVTRTTAEREPELFNIVSHTWRQRCSDSFSQNVPSQIFSKPPSFCYILKCASGNGLALTAHSQSEQNKTSHWNTNGKSRILLTEDAVMQAETSRVSFLATAICVPCSSSAKASGNSAVYILLPSSHNSNSQKALRLELSDSCSGCQGLRDAKVLQKFYCRDFFFNKEFLSCDRYSLAISKSSWKWWGLESCLPISAVTDVLPQSLHLLPLTLETPEGSLVSLEGVIEEVDENLSFSYENCENCGSHQLAMQYKGHRLWCMDCKQPSLFPVVKMEMVVVLYCSSVNSRVKVELTQKTIRVLLPQDLSEEGYDVEQVYGRQMVLSSCVVLQNQKDSKATRIVENNHDVMFYLKEIEWC